MRPSKDLYYLDIAIAVAKRSTCLHSKYGAVIVKDDRIISTGYNGSPRGAENCCDLGVCYRDENSIPKDRDAATHGNKYGTCVAVHAEQNAIINASRKDMRGATLYLACISAKDYTYKTAVPCNICSNMIANAGIAHVVADRKSVTAH